MKMIMSAIISEQSGGYPQPLIMVILPLTNSMLLIALICQSHKMLFQVIATRTLYFLGITGSKAILLFKHQKLLVWTGQ
jgi:hypothetical protein